MLCSYISLHGLNNITVKNKCPLPLMIAAFDSLQDWIRVAEEWETGFTLP